MAEEKEKLSRALFMEAEESEFKTNDGDVIQYYRYYVTVMGVKIYLKTLDKTGAELVKNYFKAVID